MGLARLVLARHGTDHHAGSTRAGGSAFNPASTGNGVRILARGLDLAAPLLDVRQQIARLADRLCIPRGLRQGRV